MLLSSALHKLRSVAAGHDPKSSSSSTAPQATVRTTLRAARASRDECPEPLGTRKLRSTPGRRRYGDLDGSVAEPSQPGGEGAIDTHRSAFAVSHSSCTSECMNAQPPIPSDRVLSGDCGRSCSSGAASFASSSSPPGSIHAAPGALAIWTGLDAAGHRVLTSRRRQSVPPSPTKCRKIKTAFGIGDDDDSFPVLASSDGALPESRTEPPALLLTRIKPRPPPLTFTVSDTAAAGLFDPAYTMESPAVTLQRAHSSCRREHLPIKTFTPPPPLVTTTATSAARISTTLSVLTRSSTLSSSSAGTSPSSVSSSLSPLTRSNSRLQAFTRRRRSTLKRFSLPSTPSLPPLSPTVTSEGQALERRYSEQQQRHVVYVGATKLERNTSLGSSYGTCGSSPSGPATPADGSPLLSSPTSFFSSSAVDVEAALTSLQSESELDVVPASSGRPIKSETRNVSFDLPFTDLNQSHRLGPAGHSSGPSDDTPTRASPERWHGHARSLSEGMIFENTAGWTSAYYRPTLWLAEEELPLTVTNPDVSQTPRGGGSRPDSAASFTSDGARPLWTQRQLHAPSVRPTPPPPPLPGATQRQPPPPPPSGFIDSSDHLPDPPDPTPSSLSVSTWSSRDAEDPPRRDRSGPPPPPPPAAPCRTGRTVREASSQSSFAAAAAATTPARSQLEVGVTVSLNKQQQEQDTQTRFRRTEVGIAC